MLTLRDGFVNRQHAEAGADLIDEDQKEIRTPVGQLGLKLAEILPGGFTGSGRWRRPARPWAQRTGRARAAAGPEIRAFCLSERRWDGGVAQAIGRQSVADWLDRIRAPKALRAMATGLRGFFLADPDQLSLLALVEQFAEDGPPGGEKMFRVAGGNDRIAAALAKPLGKQLRLETVLRAVTQSARGVRASIETDAAASIRSRRTICICAMPAATLRDVTFDPCDAGSSGEAIPRSATAPPRRRRCSSTAPHGANADNPAHSARTSRSAPSGTATKNSAAPAAFSR